MDYAGFLLRTERLKRNWSQEGLCSGICTVSYLSKIEQGKVEASPALLQLLFQRMDLLWYGEDSCRREAILQAYEQLFDLDPGLQDFLSGLEEEEFRYSPYGPDWLLLRRLTVDERPLEEELEICLSHRQLALQRLLQGRGQEAVSLFPSAYVLYRAGLSDYHRGNYAMALELLERSYQLAAQEGRPRLMLYGKLMMGNCYSNQRSDTTMEQHFTVAKRLARALGDGEALRSMDYNRAATRLELGRYEEALHYFETLDGPGKMDLHKLAICYEKLGRREDAAKALERADRLPPCEYLPEGLDDELLALVRFRLENPAYCRDTEYGKRLLAAFDRCRRELPSGYALFHLPWVLEWYEANRQYKQALLLMREFSPMREKQRG